MASPALRDRLDALDWAALGASLDERGYALTPPVLSGRQCRELAALLGQPRRFRKRIDMAGHGYGEGEYRYFAYPLPRPVYELRRRLYPPLARIANRWAERLRRPERFPDSLREFLARCRAGGQRRPTPLLLDYAAGGYNRLHQDRYGPIWFPLQAACCLSRPGLDFEGGEFLLLEGRARQQSRGEALNPERGALLIFSGGDRPVAGARGDVRVSTRHGVSRVRGGRRTALGIVFHDAA